MTPSREAVRLLGAQGPIVSLTDLPDESGLYALWASSTAALNAIGVTDERLLDAPLYVGKAEDSIRKRVAGTHFRSGKTGWSTVRRTFAGLLDLQSIPRQGNSAIERRTSNYGLTPTDEERLTSWMVTSLLVRAAPVAVTEIRETEHAVTVVLEPALNIKNAAWASELRTRAKASRARLRVRARNGV